MRNYDELVQRLREWYDNETARYDMNEAADAIVQLQARVAELSERNEQIQVQLAGCGVAALQNTRQSIAEQRIGRDQYGFSGSYEEVCNAVDREIDWRERAERAEAQVDELNLQTVSTATYTREIARTQRAEAERDQLQADLAAARALLAAIRDNGINATIEELIDAALAAKDAPC